MKNIILAVLFACINGLAFSQMEIKNERVFTGAALYGFMNGGADLYYEYGFKELVSREITYNGEDFTVDTYTMNTPLDAFGIYSINVHKCMRADTLGRFDCLSKYQLQAVDNNSYVSIVFHSGTEKARKDAEELYRMFVVDGNPQIRIPGQLTYMAKSFSGTIKYMKGKLGLNNVQPSLVELLEDIDSYEVWLVDNRENTENVILLLVQNSKDGLLLQKRIPPEKIIRKGEKFVMMKG